MKHMVSLGSETFQDVRTATAKKEKKGEKKQLAHRASVMHQHQLSTNCVPHPAGATSVKTDEAPAVWMDRNS